MKTLKNSLTILLITFISMNVTAQKATKQVKKKQVEKKTGCISGNCKNGFGKYMYSNSKNYKKFYEGEFKNGLKNGKGTFHDESFGRVNKKYVGQFKDDEFHGKGTLTYLGTYTGQFYKGLMHGHGKQKSIVGWTFEGEFKYDKNHKGTFLFKDGSKYVGQFVNGKRGGQGKFYDKTGKLIFEGRFREGKPIKKSEVTKGKKQYKVGVYEGEIINGLADGYGVFKMTNGMIYRGIFKEDKAYGYGIMTFPDGSKYEGYFKNDMFNGYGIMTDKNGKKTFAEWENNKKKTSMFNTLWDN